MKFEQLMLLDANVGRIIQELKDGTVIYKTDDSSQFIQRVAANAKKFTIIYTPRGHKIPFPITQQNFDKMFGCLRELASKAIIHRDLTPNHFLCTKNEKSDEIEKIILIDFGSAVFIKDGKLNKSTLESSDATDEHHKYRGSVRFAAKDILEHLIKRIKYKQE